MKEDRVREKKKKRVRRKGGVDGLVMMMRMERPRTWYFVLAEKTGGDGLQRRIWEWRDVCVPYL